MTFFQDEVLGTVHIRRSSQAKLLRFRIKPDGDLSVSAPKRMPLFMIKRSVLSSREELRALRSTQSPQLKLASGDTIGKSHRLLIRSGQANSVNRDQLQITVTLEPGSALTDTKVQSDLRAQIIKALRREAESYLPKRLAYLADQHSFSYQRTRLSHASSRWGSCSSTGTISLNIALMKLPFELIDYVLIHELTHTRYMNHSPAFWKDVGQYDPEFKVHRAALKQESPAI